MKAEDLIVFVDQLTGKSYTFEEFKKVILQVTTQCVDHQRERDVAIVQAMIDSYKGSADYHTISISKLRTRLEEIKERIEATK